MDKIKAVDVVQSLLNEINLRSTVTVAEGVNTLPESVKLAKDFLKQENEPDTTLLSKAATLVSNSCGFPCEVLVYTGHGFRIAPELEMVEGNIAVYAFLSRFNKFYEEAHQQISGGNDVLIFTDLVSAMFDFCGYWEPYRVMNIQEATRVQIICRQVQQKTAAELVKKEKRG